MVITCCFCWGLMNMVLVIVFVNCILELLFLGSGLYRFLFCLVWHLWSLVNKTCLMLLYSPPCMLFISRCGMPSANELFLYRNWLFYTRVVLCPLRLEKRTGCLSFTFRRLEIKTTWGVGDEAFNFFSSFSSCKCGPKIL